MAAKSLRKFFPNKKARVIIRAKTIASSCHSTKAEQQARRCLLDHSDWYKKNLFFIFF